VAIIVKAKPGESTTQLIRKFKRKVQKNQLLTTLRDKQFYKKPSELKKEKLKELKRKRHRNE
jgi:small subunit ribosomal protein S21